MSVRGFLLIWSGKRDSNSRPRPWQGRALPAELFPLNQRMRIVMSFTFLSRQIIDFPDFRKGLARRLLSSPTSTRKLNLQRYTTIFYRLLGSESPIVGLHTA